MLAIRKIMVPVDFSESSRSALRYGLEFASKLEAEVSVLHVAWIPAAYLGTELIMTEVATKSQTLQEYTQSRAEELLRSMVSEVGPEQGPPVRQEVTSGDAAKEIIHRAKVESVDLVVMGTHGRSGLDHWLIGSVAEKVVRGAPCPVLTVRYKGGKDRAHP